MISKSDRSVKSDRYEILFLGIIAIQISQIIVISGDWTLLEPVYRNKYSISTKPESRSSPLDPLYLSEILILC